MNQLDNIDLMDWMVQYCGEAFEAYKVFGGEGRALDGHHFQTAQSVDDFRRYDIKEIHAHRLWYEKMKMARRANLAMSSAGFSTGMTVTTYTRLLIFC